MKWRCQAGAPGGGAWGCLHDLVVCPRPPWPELEESPSGSLRATGTRPAEPSPRSKEPGGEGGEGCILSPSLVQARAGCMVASGSPGSLKQGGSSEKVSRGSRLQTCPGWSGDLQIKTVSIQVGWEHSF